MPRGSAFDAATEVMITDEFILIRGNQNLRATLLQMLSNQQLNNPTLSGTVIVTESTPGAADQALIVAGTNVMNEMAFHAKKSNPVFEIAITTPVLKIGTAVAATEITATADELNYVDGVTAPIQEQLAGKQPLSSAITAELNHLAGVTSPIQGQLDGKALISRTDKGSTSTILQRGTSVDIVVGINSLVVSTTGTSILGQLISNDLAAFSGSLVVSPSAGKELNISTANLVVPISATDAGLAGNIRIDANFIYYCVATNTWKRTPLTTW